MPAEHANCSNAFAAQRSGPDVTAPAYLDRARARWPAGYFASTAAAAALILLCFSAGQTATVVASQAGFCHRARS